MHAGVVTWDVLICRIMQRVFLHAMEIIHSLLQQWQRYVMLQICHLPPIHHLALLQDTASWHLQSATTSLDVLTGALQALQPSNVSYPAFDLGSLVGLVGPVAAKRVEGGPVVRSAFMHEGGDVLPFCMVLVAVNYCLQHI